MTRLYLYFTVILFIICNGCAPENESKKFVIAFSQCVGNDAWRETMLDDMKRELSFYPEIQFLYRDAEGDNSKQINQIRELTQEGIDILIVSPNEADPLTAIVDSVYQLNIPVIVTDRKTSSGLYNAYVGADNMAIGRLAGQYIKQIQNDAGAVSIVKGLKGSSASLERERGFREYLSRQSNIIVKHEIQGNWLKAEAYTQASLQHHKLIETDVILAFNDQMALGVHQALSNHYPEIPKIIGVDALPGEGNGLDEVIKGKLSASMLYPTGGTEAIRTAIAILNRKPYNRENILGTLVINQDNAEIMLLQSNKIQEQQKDIDKRQGLLIEQNKIYQNQQSTLNIVVVSLVLAVVFGGISIIVIKSNWDKNKNLENKNHEILLQQQQILSMNNNIKEAAEAKSIFFTKISHEFKTPLTLIVAPLEELEKEKTISEEGREQITRIKRNAHKLQNLIKELIDIQRLEKNSLKLNVTRIKLNHFFHLLLNNFRPLALRNRISLTYSNKSKVKDLCLDEFLMDQVFSNLLSNAFKFTSIAGKISIVIEDVEDESTIHIKIADNGIGIAAEDIDHVFDPFYKGNHYSAGSGIGLSYAKDIIELHQGSIKVKSTENIGTTFIISLPIHNVHFQENDSNFQSDHTNQKYPAFDYQLDSAEDEMEDSAIFSSKKASTLLIIEDQADIRKFLKTVLEKDYNIVFSKNYAEAKDKILTSYPDLVISDILLPDGNGMELIKQIKNDPNTAQIPVLVLTALDSNENKVQANQLMADAYLTKPFAVTHLKSVISNLISSRDRLKEYFKGSSYDKYTINYENLTFLDRQFIKSLNAYIESRIHHSTLNVEEVATALHMSRVQLYRKTKKLLQMSVNDYILKCRLDKSKHLISEGFNINEVAQQIGFSNSTYFTAVFKKQYGVTPSGYKKNAY